MVGVEYVGHSKTMFSVYKCARRERGRWGVGGPGIASPKWNFQSRSSGKAVLRPESSLRG